MDILKVKVNNEWVAIPSITGQRGIGIQSITKTNTQGLVDTYTILFSDGNSTTFNISNGAVPSFTIGTVTEGPTAAVTVTGTDTNPVLNLTLPNANVPTAVSELNNDAGYATESYVNTAISNVNTMKIHICTQGEYNAETGIPTIQNPDTQTFYLVPGGEGNNLFIEWAYVDNAWERFGSADVEVPVTDVQVNGVSVLSDGVANIPKANASTVGVVLPHQNSFEYYQGALRPRVASASDIKTGTDSWHMLTSSTEQNSTFYGLAKAAGADMKDIANTTIGTYPDAQKEAIQSMLGITQMLAPENPNLVATKAYAIGDVFAANGHLYKATAAIAQDEAIIPDTNCVETTMVDAGGKIKDVQVAGTSVVGNNGVANVPIASSSTPGAVAIGNGLFINQNGAIMIEKAIDANIKIGTHQYLSIVPYNQHSATFYGLSKVAGVDLANETVTLGTYPETSKTAIKAMLGVQDGLKVVRLI